MADGMSVSGSLTAPVFLSIVFADLFDSLRTAILIVDRDLRVHSINRAARGLLTTVEASVGPQGELKLGATATDARFRSLCEGALAEAREREQPVTRMLRAGRGGANGSLLVYLHVRPKWAGDPNSAIVVVLTELAFRIEATELLRELNGFTRKESAVVQRLLEGRRLAEIGAQLKMAPETVRAHVKRAFKKCGVHSQPQLVQCVALQLFGPLQFCNTL